jgi:hypothetical protein
MSQSIQIWVAVRVYLHPYFNRFRLPVLPGLTNLVELVLLGCPLSRKQGYRMQLMARFPRLCVADGQVRAEVCASRVKLCECTTQVRCCDSSTELTRSQPQTISYEERMQADAMLAMQQQQQQTAGIGVVGAAGMGMGDAVPAAGYVAGMGLGPAAQRFMMAGAGHGLGAASAAAQVH